MTTAFVGWKSSQGPQDTNAAWIWAAVAAVFLVCGIFALHVGKQHRKLTSLRADDIVTFMESWEKQWLGARAGLGPLDTLGRSTLRVEDVIGSWHLTFDPRNQRGKIVDLSPDGNIGEGRNKNEYQWRLQNGLLEIVNAAEKVHNRFKCDPQDGRLKGTNDPDTIAFKDQVMVRIRG